MSRNLKALGLAMVAALALSAVVASAAQAANHHLTVPTAPAIITAEDHEATVFKTTENKREVRCNTADYRGTVSATTNAEVTVAPEYGECKVIEGPLEITATVDTNHCAYILTGETDVNEDAKTHLECEGTDEITITYKVFGSECIVHVTPQTPAGGVHYTQTTNATTGKKDVTVKITVSGIKYHETEKGFCPKNHTGIDGTLSGAVTAQAYKANCGPTGTELTTPKTKLNECQGTVQDLELTTT